VTERRAHHARHGEATEGIVQLPSGVTFDLARLYADLPD